MIDTGSEPIEKRLFRNDFILRFNEPNLVTEIRCDFRIKGGRALGPMPQPRMGLQIWSQETRQFVSVLIVIEDNPVALDELSIIRSLEAMILRRLFCRSVVQLDLEHDDSRPEIETKTIRLVKPVTREQEAVIIHPSIFLHIGRIGRIVLITIIRSRNVALLPPVALDLASGTGRPVHRLKMTVGIIGSSRTGNPGSDGIGSPVISLPGVEHRRVQDALSLDGTVRIGRFGNAKLYRLDVQVAVLDGTNYLGWKKAVGNHPLDGLVRRIQFGIERVHLVSDPEGRRLRPVGKLELQCETIFLSALERGNLRRGVLQLVLIRIGAFIRHIRNVLPVIKTVGRIVEADAVTCPVRLSVDIPFLVIGVFLDCVLDGREIVSDGLQVAKEKRLVLMLERARVNRLTPEIEKMTGVLRGKMSAIINDGERIGGRFSFFDKVSGDSTVQRTAEDGVNPKMSKRRVKVLELQEHAVHIRIISRSAVVVRREIHNVRHPDIPSLLTVLVEISQQILDDTVRPVVTGVVLGDAYLDIELSRTVGIEACSVPVPACLLHFVSHKVHEPKNVYPVYPVDFLDGLGLEIHDGLDGMFQIKAEIVRVKEIADKLDIISDVIVNPVNPVSSSFVSEQDNMIVQHVPSKQRSVNRIGQFDFLVSSFVRDGEKRIVVSGKDTDVMVLIRRRLARLGNGQVAVHSTIL